MLWVPGMPKAKGMPSYSSARTTIAPPPSFISPRSRQRLRLGPDALGDAVREAHHGEVRVDLQRVGEEACVGDAEPRNTVHSPPRVGDRILDAPAPPAGAH